MATGIVIALGCSDASSTSNSSTPPPQESVTSADMVDVPVFASGDLAELGAYLPPLDEDRLKVAPPKGWKVEPRNKAYVTRFVYSKTGLPLPRITVEAEDVAWDDLKDADKDNHLEFVGLIGNALDEKTREALQEPVDPIILGDICCVRYVVSKVFRHGERTFTGNREVIQTLRDGRVYSVLLDVYPNQLPDYRADAYAVVAGMQFLVATADEKPPSGL